MGDFGINEMQKMQKELQEKYKNIWSPIEPKLGDKKLLWMIGEIGEVIDIIKKNGVEKVMNDDKLKSDLVEEMTDVLMYYNEVLMCYGITTQELKEAYVNKFKKNMTRW